MMRKRRKGGGGGGGGGGERMRRRQEITHKGPPPELLLQPVLLQLQLLDSPHEHGLRHRGRTVNLATVTSSLTPSDLRYLQLSTGREEESPRVTRSKGHDITL
eukprot:752601-Hanusia_phi.AAC.2